MKKKLVMIGIIVFIFMLGVKYIPFGTYYTTKTIGKLEVPKLSMLKEECCMFSATFKSFRSTYILKQELNKIMNKLEKKICNNTIYYYDKENDITISEYGVKANFLLNEFYIVYDKGRISCDNKSEVSVTLTLKEGTLTSTGATFILKNNTPNVYIYGEPWYLEVYKNDEWHKLDTINDLHFILPAYELKPNDTKEISVSWDYAYGELKQGIYRFVKDLSRETNSSIPEYEAANVYAVFEIK